MSRAEYKLLTHSELTSKACGYFISRRTESVIHGHTNAFMNMLHTL